MKSIAEWRGDNRKKINELQDRATEIIQSEQYRENMNKTSGAYRTTKVLRCISSESQLDRRKNSVLNKHLKKKWLKTSHIWQKTQTYKFKRVIGPNKLNQKKKENQPTGLN